MGWRLANEVLDNAPDDLGPAERLVLSVLAGYVVDEESRVCWPGMDKLVKRTGLKPDSLRKVFQRLAKRGLDPRVPIGTDKKGNSVFAHESARTTYRVPRFKSRDDSPTTETGQASHHSEPRGGTTVPERRDSHPPEEGPASRPEVVERSGTTLSSSVPRQATARQPAAEREKEAAPKSNGSGGDVAKVVEAWSAARSKGRNPAAEERVRRSASQLLSVGWSIPDLIAMAEDMGRRQPSFTDLAKHEPHWVRPVHERASPGSRARVVTDDTYGRWPECADCKNPLSRASTEPLCPQCRALQQAGA